MGKFGERPNRAENVMMNDLMAMTSELIRHSPSIRERMQAYRYGWRDVRLLLALARKVENMLYYTMPPSYQRRYAQVAKEGRVMVDIPGPIQDKQNMLVERRDLDVLVEKALTGECVMCIREGKDIQRCPLRDVMVRLSPPVEFTGDRTHAICEYQRAAMSAMAKEYTIV